MSADTWPPGFTPDPTPLKPSRGPLQYLRMRDTQLSRGNTGTMVETFRNAASNIPDPSKARLALPAKKGKRK